MLQRKTLSAEVRPPREHAYNRCKHIHTHVHTHLNKFKTWEYRTGLVGYSLSKKSTTVFWKVASSFFIPYLHFLQMLRRIWGNRRIKCTDFWSSAKTQGSTISRFTLVLVHHLHPLPKRVVSGPTSVKLQTEREHPSGKLTAKDPLHTVWTRTAMSSSDTEKGLWYFTTNGRHVWEILTTRDDQRNVGRASNSFLSARQGRWYFLVSSGLPEQEVSPRSHPWDTNYSKTNLLSYQKNWTLRGCPTQRGPKADLTLEGLAHMSTT